MWNYPPWVLCKRCFYFDSILNGQYIPVTESTAYAWLFNAHTLTHTRHTPSPTHDTHPHPHTTHTLTHTRHTPSPTHYTHPHPHTTHTLTHILHTPTPTHICTHHLIRSHAYKYTQTQHDRHKRRTTKETMKVPSHTVGQLLSVTSLALCCMWLWWLHFWLVSSVTLLTPIICHLSLLISFRDFKYQLIHSPPSWTAPSWCMFDVTSIIAP